MISGDNVDTAAVMAMQAGILNENDYHIDKQNKKSEKDEIRRQQTELVDLENQPQRELKPVYVIDAHNLQKEIFGQFLNKKVENNVKITLQDICGPAILKKEGDENPRNLKYELEPHKQ